MDDRAIDSTREKETTNFKTYIHRILSNMCKILFKKRRTTDSLNLEEPLRKPDMKVLEQ